jgi:hypothetical protein
VSKVPGSEEVVETPNEEVIETPEVVKDPPAEEVVEEKEGEEGKEKAPSNVFTPNFKYKVMDQEKEFDPLFKGVIKTKEDEDKVRDILTKVEGFDAFKSNHAKLQEKHTSLEQDYNQNVVPYVREVESIKSLVAAPNFEQRDYDSFFQKLGIPKDHILKYTKSILDYQDASPEQRAAIDNQRAMQAQMRQQQEQSHVLSSQNQSLAVQARTFELNTELAQPEVSSFAAAFDNLHGNGAFRNQVIQNGALIFHNEKRDVPPSELVKLVMGQFSGIQKVQPQVVPPQNQNPPVVQTPPAKKPVIPNVAGSGGSPAKKVFTNLDEIRAHRKTLRQA